jgi:hypothetical protein
MKEPPPSCQVLFIYKERSFILRIATQSKALIVVLTILSPLRYRYVLA